MSAVGLHFTLSGSNDEGASFRYSSTTHRENLHSCILKANDFEARSILPEGLLLEFKPVSSQDSHLLSKKKTQREKSGRNATASN